MFWCDFRKKTTSIKIFHFLAEIFCNASNVDIFNQIFVEDVEPLLFGNILLGNVLYNNWITDMYNVNVTGEKTNMQIFISEWIPIIKFFVCTDTSTIARLERRKKITFRQRVLLAPIK